MTTRTVCSVDRATAFNRIPPIYATALRLRDQGFTAAEIAEQVDVPIEAIGPLLLIAEQKLERLVGE